jgi:hypothetical protein
MHYREIFSVKILKSFGEKHDAVLLRTNPFRAIWINCIDIRDARHNAN